MRSVKTSKDYQAQFRKAKERVEPEYFEVVQSQGSVTSLNSGPMRKNNFIKEEPNAPDVTGDLTGNYIPKKSVQEDDTGKYSEFL